MHQQFLSDPLRKSWDKRLRVDVNVYFIRNVIGVLAVFCNTEYEK